MNKTNCSSVTQDLERRIEAGRAWFISGAGLDFDGPELRGNATRIRVSEFLDLENRVERYGLAFRVEARGPGKTIKFQVNVRIKPIASEGPVDRSHPYVVTYVVDQFGGTEGEITHDHFADPSSYAALAQLSTHDWYVNWLRRAFATGSGKFFSDGVLIA